MEDYLAKISLSDKLNNNYELENLLLKRIKEEIESYAKKFQGDKSKFTSGTASSILSGLTGGLGLGINTIASSSVNLIMGIIKDREALGTISSKVREIIVEVSKQAMANDQLLEHKLRQDYGEEKAKDLIRVIKDFDFKLLILSSSSCDVMKASSTRQELVSSCYGILKVKEESREKLSKSLRENFILHLTSLKLGIQKHEL